MERFLKPFLEERKQAVFKEICEKEKMQCEVRNNQKLEQEKFSKIKQLKEKIQSEIDSSIEDFFNTATCEFYSYIRSPNFRKEIFKDAGSCTKFEIEERIISSIDKATARWQQNHMKAIFDRTVMKKLDRTYSDFSKRLTDLDTKIQRDGEHYDFNKQVVTPLLVSGGSAVVTALSVFVFPPASVFVLGGITAAGTSGFTTGLFHAAINAFRSFDDIRQSVFETEISTFSKKSIERGFREGYKQFIESDIVSDIESHMQSEINASTQCIKD